MTNVFQSAAIAFHKFANNLKGADYEGYIGHLRSNTSANFWEMLYWSVLTKNYD